MEYGDNTHSERHDPLAGLDHQAICDELVDQLSGDYSQYVSRHYDAIKNTNNQIFDAYDLISQSIAHANYRGTIDTLYAVGRFKGGMVVAIRLLESLADSCDIAREDFYRAWEESRVFELPNPTSETTGAMSKHERMQLIGEHLLYSGEEAYKNLPDEYGRLTSQLYPMTDGNDEYNEAASAGMGYVLQSGYETLQYLKFGGATSDSERDRELDEMAGYSGSNWEASQSGLFEQVMDVLKSPEANMQEKIDAIVAENDEKTQTVFANLSIILYPSEFEPFTTDTSSEAFFAGANIGAYLWRSSHSDDSDDQQKIIKKWRNERLHARLLAGVGSPSLAADGRKALANYALDSDISEKFLDIERYIQAQLEYENGPSAAFHKGFIYGVASHQKAARSLRYDAIGREVKLEAEGIDFEYERLVRGHDVTNIFHSVALAFEGHCEAYGFDLNDMTEGETETALEILKHDFEHMTGGIGRVAIDAPCFLIAVGKGGEPIAMSTANGSVIEGDIGSMCFAGTPIDISYLDPDRELDDIPMKQAAACVLRNATITMADGSIESFEGILIVGLAVPGARYRYPK